jgi:hypothetical protein
LYALNVICFCRHSLVSSMESPSPWTTSLSAERTDEAGNSTLMSNYTVQ